MDTDYRPLSCNYYDQLEASANLKKKVFLEYVERGITKTVKGVIEDIFTKNSEEYLVLNSGEVIRLDRIMKLGNLVFPGHSCPK